MLKKYGEKERILKVRRVTKNNLPEKGLNIYLWVMEKLTPEVKESFNLALSLLTGYERRQYAASLSKQYFDSSPRKTERELRVSRSVVELGLKEQDRGFRCIENFNLRGRKKKKIPSKI